MIWTVLSNRGVVYEGGDQQLAEALWAHETGISEVELQCDGSRYAYAAPSSRLAPAPAHARAQAAPVTNTDVIKTTSKTLLKLGFKPDRVQKLIERATLLRVYADAADMVQDCIIHNTVGV